MTPLPGDVPGSLAARGLYPAWAASPWPWGCCDGMNGHLVAGTQLLHVDPDGIANSGDEYDRRIGDR